MTRVVDQTFVSFAQNGEDVVLWRALKHIDGGCYVDVGANHPTVESISRAFYNRGWRGITVEPVPEFARLHREERPDDILVDTVVAAKSGEEMTLQVVEGTGLSTLVDSIGTQHARDGYAVHGLTVTSRTLDDVLGAAGWEGRDIHFMTIDVEGAEGDVLRGLDLRQWRPWVLVIESTRPNSTEQSHEAWEAMVLEADYEFCLFDGLSRFYVAAEHADALRASLSYPACIHDGYTTLPQERLRAQVAEVEGERETLRAKLNRMTDDAVRWRAVALTRWANAGDSARPTPDSSAQVDNLQQTVHHLHQEIDSIHRTLSWRVTAPLRAVRARQRSVAGNG